MTDVHHDHDATADAADAADDAARSDAQRTMNRRRMFIAGAGIAGAAALTKAGTASAADDDPVLVGNPDNTTNDGATVITNTNNTATTPGTGGQEAVKGELTGADNGSHAILGVTQGLGHSVAGDTPAGPNTVAATWGRHAGQGAGIGGINVATDVPLAGPARGVEGIVSQGTNGSHAVYGITNGAGHAIAGEIPEDALGPDGDGVNTVAATWGRHFGTGAGIGGISIGGYGGEFVGGRAHVRLIQDQDDADVGPPTGDGHLLGELYADGAGNLWFNTADGENFTQLNNQGGVTMMPNPQRAYDSREEYEPASTPKGMLASEETREIDLTEFTDFPAGASGAIVNITVDGTVDRGFLTAFNGATADDERPNASTVNWYESTSIVANGIILPVSPEGTIKVYAFGLAGGACTDVVIDVVGAVT
jgi:hypothetical protein